MGGVESCPPAASDAGTPPGARPVLEATVQAFVDGLADAPPIHALGFDEARAALAALQAGPVAKPPAAVEDRTFLVGPTGSVGVRILRPQDGNGRPLPAVLYLHGGGWVTGGKDTHDRLARELAVGARAAVVFVEYALAPEARYPVQNEQAYAVLDFVTANAAALGLDASRIAVAGDGAGGAMAAAVTLLAKRRRGPEIAFQLLFCPVTADLGEAGSYAAFRDGPWLTREAMRRFLDAAFPDATCRGLAAALPLQASLQQLNDLPEALIIVAENDVLRDEGEAYARRLIQAGVSATSTRYNGTIHDFVVLDGLATSPATRGAVAQATAALRAALYGG
jgi:acetyl esterase